MENAVKHGISLRTQPGTVRLAGYRQGDRLMLEITNDGPELGPAAARISRPGKPGIGLANTRARLRQAFQSDYHLEIAERSEGGMVVRIDLPVPPCAGMAVMTEARSTCTLIVDDEPLAREGLTRPARR